MWPPTLEQNVIASDRRLEVDRSTASAPAPILVTRLEDVRPRPRRVAIGNFDGVHLGHRAVIADCDTVLTFWPHPLAVLAPERAPAMLTDLHTKAELAGALGVRELVVMPFDRSIATLSATSFVDDVLIRSLSAVHVSVGTGFRYGAGATGDVDTLSANSSFTTSATRLVRAVGDTVSSSRIRAEIARGEVALAADLLERPHRMPCRVASFASFPTFPSGWAIARLALPVGHACPPAGWYASHIRCADPRWILREAPVYVTAGSGDDAQREVLAAVRRDRLGIGTPAVVEVLRSGAEAFGRPSRLLRC